MLTFNVKTSLYTHKSIMHSGEEYGINLLTWISIQMSIPAVESMIICKIPLSKPSEGPSSGELLHFGI